MSAERTCRLCRATFAEGPYIGAQDSAGGEWVLLHNCPECRATYAAGTVIDAAKCCACDHLVLGDAEDPKIIVADGTGPWRVYCADCACLDVAAASAPSVADAVAYLMVEHAVDIGAKRIERRREAEAFRARRHPQRIAS